VTKLFFFFGQGTGLRGAEMMQKGEMRKMMWVLIALSLVSRSGALWQTPLWNDPSDPNKIVGHIEYAPPHIG